MQADSRSMSALRIGIAAAFILGATSLAAFATAQSFGLSRPPGSSIPVPETPAGVINAVKLRFTKGMKLTAEDAIALRKVAGQAPLAHEPFAYLGFAAANEGKIAKAEALLIEARNRRPRSRIARLALLEIYVKRRDLPAISGELVPLMRLEPDLIEPLSQQWFKSISKPAEMKQLAEILSGEPAIYNRVAEQAATANLPPAMLSTFITNDPEAAKGRQAPFYRQILASLIRQGEYIEARRIWNLSYGSNTAGGGIFNGEFAQVKALPPFNWELFHTRNGIAELQKNGGLYVDYFGRGSEVFARQLLSLAPGRYRLSVLQSGETAGGAGLAWNITCAGANAALLDRPVHGATASNQSLTADLTVPANCTTQWLALEGRGELRKNKGQQITVTKVSISRIGGAVQ